MLLQIMMVGKKLPKVDEIMAILLAKYISLSTNDYGYGVAAEELTVNHVNTFFLKAKSAASQEKNKKLA